MIPYMKKIIFTAVLSFLVLTAASASEPTPISYIREAFVRASVVSYAPDEEVTDMFIRYSDYGKANDVLLLQLYMSVKLPDAEVDRLLGLFDREGGFWTDIDYTDKTRGRWQPTLHLTRMYALAKHYADPASEWYRDRAIGQVLHKGIAFWGREMPHCPNWWHNDIGAPKKLTAVMLMIYDELTDDELRIGLKVLERSKFGRTGQNKAWLAGNNLMKGLLTDDPALVLKARDQIAEEIVVTDGEGIQEDWSFHQHGPQIQFGNYGLAYAEGLSFWFRVLEGTSYMFSDSQRRILENFIMEGVCWSVWKGLMDPSFCGRQVFLDAGRGKAFSLSVAAQNMAALEGPDSGKFQQIALGMLLPDAYGSVLRGAKYFWRSDCGIYRSGDWYASVRMHSERTVGFEYTNSENLLANFSADGALLLMQHGREYENIFAHWDWRMVPGATTYEDGEPLKCSFDDEGKKNRSAHVGGLADDDVMCTSMELSRDGLHALKSDFFFDDVVVALGADIRSSRKEITRITTAVDQTHLVSEVVSGGNWVNHDGRGYVSLDGAALNVSTAEQKGRWDLIDPFYKDRWEKGEVFRCWFEHDAASTGSYAYALLPCRTAGETEAFAQDSPVTVLRNDAWCQAVSYRNVLCAVFHLPGEYVLGGERFVITDPSVCVVRDGKRKVTQLPAVADRPESTLSFDYGRIADHPRLLLPAGGEEKVKAMIAGDVDMKKVHEGIIAFCDSVLYVPAVERIKTGKRLLAVSREALKRIYWLSYAYRMTSDNRYADRAIGEMMAVCSFSDWNPSHFLDTGEMGMAVALGYDWLYGRLSDEQKAIVADALDRHLFKAAEDRKKSWFYTADNNWNQVCNSGMVYAALAVYESCPAEAISIIEKSIFSNRTALEVYAPDGGYPEGLGYWSYGTSFQVMMNEALMSALGSDAGFSGAEGFLESARFVQFMSAPSGMSYNFSDNGAGVPCNMMMFWFADRMQDRSLLWLERKYMASVPEDFFGSPDRWFSEARLLPSLPVFASRYGSSVPEAPDAYSWSCRGKTPLYVYRSGWERQDDVYFAIKGGSPGTSHAHMDAGSFVYEYGGVRWAMDLGSQNYYSLESRGVDLWGSRQDSGRWDVFRIGNTAHGTLTVDGRHHRVAGNAWLTVLPGKGAAVDLTEVLGKDVVKSAVRTASVDRKGFLHIEDKVHASSGPVYLQWIMVTPADVEILGQNKARLSKDGVMMLLEVRSSVPVSMNVMSNEPPHDYDAPNPGSCRVGFSADIAASSEAKFKVTLRRISK